MASTDIWAYGQQEWTTSDLTGFNVEARDGGIGTAGQTARSRNFMVARCSAALEADERGCTYRYRAWWQGVT